MALLVLLVCREAFGFASHSSGDRQLRMMCSTNRASATIL